MTESICPLHEMQKGGPFHVILSERSESKDLDAEGQLSRQPHVYAEGEDFSETVLEAEFAAGDFRGIP